VTTRITTGKRGETAARDHLAARGYVIIAANVHSGGGEIDLIARHSDVTVFVEVRTRHSADDDDALASITPRKRTRMLRAVGAYLAAHELQEQAWRIDVVAVTLRPNAAPQITHVEDALGW
jgi:putative endonuclease